MTGFKSKWVTVDGGLFSPARVPQIVVAHRLVAYSVYDGPDCAIVVVKDPKDHADMRSRKYEEMEVPQPKPAVIGPCKHRGEEIGRAKCSKCRGNVQVKLYACTLHGKCVIGMAGAKVGSEEVRVCETCPDKS